MKDGTENLLKFKHLERDLGLEEWQVMGLLTALWKFVKKNCPRGDIGRFSNEDIALGIKYSGDADRLITALINRHWLDACECEMRLIIHDWAHHAEESVHRQLARRFDWFADGTAPSISRLTGKEKERAEKHYAEKVCGHVARRAYHGRTTGVPGKPQPEPLPAPEPSLAKPEPKPPAGTRKKPERFTLTEVPFPEALDTPEARTAASEWLEHKRSRNEAYKSPLSFAKKLAEWARAGPVAFVEAVNASIGNNYAGIYAPKDRPNGNRPTDNAAAQRHDASRSLPGFGPARPATGQPAEAN